MSSKYIYFFGSDAAKKNLTEGKADMKTLLGGKGANLAEMANLGLPVPAGFTVTTEVCTYFYKNDKKYPAELKALVTDAMKKLEGCMGLGFGSDSKPMLVSVRSGARASMPGMMDTILNLGLNDKTVEALAKNTNNPRFAYDCYRRFIQMYADVVLNIHVSQFESLLEHLKADRNLTKDSDLQPADLKKLIEAYKQRVLEETGRKFPQDPEEQLWGAMGAVFSSWMSPRAIHYRKMNQIPEDWGTAVNIQAMVFGNMGDTSATGVAFTRNPATGEKILFGEFLTNAQGEDVVAGIRTPYPLSKMQKDRDAESDPALKDVPSLEELMPKVYQEFYGYQQKLEQHYKDMQDIEFTIQDGRLFMLQTRTGKRTTQASVKIAVDMVNEKLITTDEAILRIDPYGLDQLLHPRLDPKKKGTPIAKGLPASPGAVSGRVIFTSNEAEKEKAKGNRVILVRHETSPEDIHGMDAAVGILTALGGMTSHAAVVARGMGKSCIAGCADIHIDYRAKKFTVSKYGAKTEVKEGDVLTLDANTGEIFLGEIPTISSTLDKDFSQLMSWADKRRRLKVRANADTPHDARVARQFGAEGIGLCRTEHMFFEPDRIDAVRAMILAESPEERANALELIMPMQRQDFISLFREMRGLPVTIRLLDPPLHEFLPHTETDIVNLAAKLKTTTERLMTKAKALHEANPMLGHRGCRLGISFPEIYEMQVRAVAEAVVEAARLTQEPVEAEIMIPLVFEVKELAFLRERVEQVVHTILEKANLKQTLIIGTMIELPRAALTADEIATQADFFSFGTNDLTQTTLGLSRDDSSRFLPEYLDHGILKQDPFASIDQAGVGQLVKMGVQKGRVTKPGLKTGVCGEHGGDPKSVEFFHGAGLDYVSCSPFRVPAARLAAAHASIKAKS
ncbi:MAG: pyruvate, phosphate dikinase [Bdellovibrionales bacterium]|nr:pyruvate, phosphate dikinase [Bdellovibrionales bacterium]